LNKAEDGNRYINRTAKGDPAKVKIARRLRQETTMTWDWIAQRLRRAIPAAGALKQYADLRDPLNDPLKGSLIKSMSLRTVGVANFIKILLSRT
jgi:hypothetical protein